MIYHDLPSMLMVIIHRDVKSPLRLAMEVVNYLVNGL